MKNYLVFNEKKQTGIIVEAESLEDLQAKLADARLYEFDAYECVAKFREEKKVVNVFNKQEN